MTQQLDEGRESNGTENKRHKPVPAARLLTLFQACEYSGLSEWKLRKLVHDGVLPIVELNGGEKWWIDRKDLDALIDRSKRLL
jgi:excisionase family DNA binding protein